jgi:hypothetical protein
VQFGGQTYPTVGIVNGRAEWKIVDGSDYKSFSYAGSVWRYEEFLSGEGTTYDSAATTAFRPEQADWSASGLGSSPTTSSTFGIVRAATNEPRFDHTSDGVCRGLLIEESRTNICLQSENFGTTWTNDSGAVTITTDVEVSPDGSTTADKIAESTSTTNRRISIQSISVTSGTTYSYSCYIKAGERDFAQMATGTGLNSAFQNFIINGANAGTLGSSSGIVSSRIDAMPNGWYRCTIVVTAAATGTTQVTVGPAPSSTITRWQAYSSTAGSGIYAWGAQVEAGSFPTSYIPTVASSVVRSADVCSISGADFSSFFNPNASTAVAISQVNGFTTGNAVVYSFSPGFSLFHRVAQLNRLTSSTPAGQLTPASGFNSVGAIYRSAFAIDANGSSYVIDGTVIPDTRPGAVLTSNSLLLSTSSSFKTIASIRYFRKRLPDAKLQALTA